jgi:hypothetical protein
MNPEISSVAESDGSWTEAERKKIGGKQGYGPEHKHIRVEMTCR